MTSPMASACADPERRTTAKECARRLLARSAAAPASPAASAGQATGRSTASTGSGGWPSARWLATGDRWRFCRRACWLEDALLDLVDATVFGRREARLPPPAQGASAHSPADAPPPSGSGFT